MSKEVFQVSFEIKNLTPSDVTVLIGSLRASVLQVTRASAQKIEVIQISPEVQEAIPE